MADDLVLNGNRSVGVFVTADDVSKLVCLFVCSLFD